MPIFDTHAHYLDHAFDEDRDTVLSSLFSGEVSGIIEAALDGESARAALALCERYPALYAAIGIHPENITPQVETDYAVILSLLNHPKVVAIGEIGLDYHWEDLCPRDVQKQWFEKQLQLAAERDIPVVVHDRDAHEDTFALLKKYRPKGVVHCFSGSVEMMREMLKLGLYIGIGGVVTFKNARKTVEVAKEIPLDRLLLETDAPYLAPVPFRGTRCTSDMIRKTAEIIADLRNMPVEELLSLTEQNAHNLYRI